MSDGVGIENPQLGADTPGLCQASCVDRLMGLRYGPGHIAHEEVAFRKPGPIQGVAAPGFLSSAVESLPDLPSCGVCMRARILSRKVEEATARDAREFGLFEVRNPVRLFIRAFGFGKYLPGLDSCPAKGSNPAHGRKRPGLSGVEHGTEPWSCSTPYTVLCKAHELKRVLGPVLVQHLPCHACQYVGAERSVTAGMGGS